MVKVTVQKLADALGVTTETIRHYRKEGLLHPKARENGYYEYTEQDALSVLLTKEMRSYDMALDFIKESYEKSTIADYNQFLAGREAELRRQMERIRLELARMHETRVYASCGVRLLGKVEEFDGPSTWAVSVLNREEGFLSGHSLEKWVEHFPFTYVSATVPMEELLEKHGAEPYGVQIGAGALIHYVEEFQLPLGDRAFYQPGGHFIRTCVAIRDIFSLCSEDLSPLLNYAREHHYTFASCTGGRLLFIENAAEVPLYYLLVWARVEPV